MGNLIEWFNGKKTVIGTLLLLGSAVIDQVLGGIWGLKSETFTAISQTCDWIGMAFGGAGITHKFTKYRADEKKRIEEAGK